MNQSKLIGHSWWQYWLSGTALFKFGIGFGFWPHGILVLILTSKQTLYKCWILSWIWKKNYPFSVSTSVLVYSSSLDCFRISILDFQHAMNWNLYWFLSKDGQICGFDIGVVIHWGWRLPSVLILTHGSTFDWYRIWFRIELSRANFSISIPNQRLSHDSVSKPKSDQNRWGPTGQTKVSSSTFDRFFWEEGVGKPKLT